MKTHDWKNSLKNKMNADRTSHETALAKERFMQKIQRENQSTQELKSNGFLVWLSIPVMALGVIFFFQTIQFQPLMSHKMSLAHNSQILQTQAEIDEIITTSYLEGFDEGANFDEEIGE